MSWLPLTSDSAAANANAKVVLSYAKTSSVACAHDLYPITQIEETTATAYRGLTEAAAKTLAASLKADTVKSVYLYGQTASNSEAVVAVLSGSRTNVRAERADESGQWQVTAETTEYSNAYASVAWATSMPASSSDAAVLSETTQTSLSYVGYHFASATTVKHTDGTVSYLNPVVERIWVKEVTTTKSVRSSVKTEPAATCEEVLYYANFDGNGGVEVRSGTRTAISSSRLPNGRGWVTTTSTTTFTPQATLV